MYSRQYPSYQKGRPIIMSVGQHVIARTSYGIVSGILCRTKIGELLLDVIKVFCCENQHLVESIIPIDFMEIVAWKPFKEWECKEYIEDRKGRSVHVVTIIENIKQSPKERGSPI